MPKQDAEFNRSVFINCPFDEQYEPILQAILFCLTYLRFKPRIASESRDSGESRLEKIKDLVTNSKYSIHDLSRCQAKNKGEMYRLNMPFELGLDYGCREYGNKRYSNKKILILEEKRFRYQASLSDLSGCDIQIHSNSFEQAIRQVRNWLVSEAQAKRIGASLIKGKYFQFQEWHYEKQLNAGFSEEDIQDYPTNELLNAMQEWLKTQ